MYQKYMLYTYPDCKRLREFIYFIMILFLMILFVHEVIGYWLYLFKSRNGGSRNNRKQAGAELCQAQFKLRLAEPAVASHVIASFAS